MGGTRIRRRRRRRYTALVTKLVAGRSASVPRNPAGSPKLSTIVTSCWCSTIAACAWRVRAVSCRAVHLLPRGCKQALSLARRRVDVRHAMPSEGVPGGACRSLVQLDKPIGAHPTARQSAAARTSRRIARLASDGWVPCQDLGHGSPGPASGAATNAVIRSPVVAATRACDPSSPVSSEAEANESQARTGDQPSHPSGEGRSACPHGIGVMRFPHAIALPRLPLVRAGQARRSYLPSELAGASWIYQTNGGEGSKLHPPLTDC